MQAKKIPFAAAAALFALALGLAGCSPAGPKAFFAGQSALERGDYETAASRLKTATTLLATNAEVWNAYGMALQGDQQPQAAATAYQRALDLDRDLVEAHFNLGNLWLEQNQPEAARSEFLAYALRRGNDPDGWLKLGSAELRLGETASAEKSFSKVLYLKPGDAAACNGLGLARVQRGMPRDAARYFAAALRTEPGYAPALLNLATVSHSYLRDDKTALVNYRAYLALTPPPPDWDQVNGLVNQLEHAKPSDTEAPAALMKPAETWQAPAAPAARPPRQEAAHRPPPAPETTEAAPPAALEPRRVAPAAPVSSAPLQVVQVAAPQEIFASPRAAAELPPPLAASRAEPAAAGGGQTGGFWHRIFAPPAKPGEPESPYLATGVTPLPSPGGDAAPPQPAVVPLSHFPRYQYLSPRNPGPGRHGNGTPAAAAFTQAQLREQQEDWPAALQNYQQAAEADPGWFLAQYNTAALAQRLRNYSQALTAYEYALACRPGAVDARYNFALALRAAGYVPDAVQELDKILAARPDDARAQLALANIYAQTLHDPATARRHYVKVLELDPATPQAADIRFWLAANPG